jgi:hypothetical protein
MRRLAIVECLAALVFLVSAGLADIPKLINYQGMLTDDSGNPLTGSYDLTFYIYDDTTGGELEWSETQSGVQVQDGLFNVVLGKQTVLNEAFDESYWLAVKVGTETMPRVRITSVGYAYRAKIADSATVAVSAPTGGGWTDNGTVIKLQTYSDSVGIGTGLPAEKLHVAGDIRLWAGGDIAFGDDNTRVYESADNLHVTADNDVYLQPDDDIYIRPDGGSDWIRIDPGAKEVGIGTTEPTEMLHVENSNSGAKAFLKIETSHASDWGEVGMRIETPDNMWHLRMDDDSHNNLPDTGSLALRSQNSGIEVMTWTDDGHVGIRTTQPSAELDVNGDLEVTGAYKGEISSYSGSDGAPFPRPAYESDWWDMSQGQGRTLVHRVGGDVDDYVVQMQLWDAVLGMHNHGMGSYLAYVSAELRSYGAHWHSLTDSTIDIKRWEDDYYADKIRIRIWVIK